jgi:predicted metal-binding protein
MPAGRAAARSRPFRPQEAARNGRIHVKGGREVVIHVCVTCRREEDLDAVRPGARLAEELAPMVSESARLVAVECLGNCKRGCTVAIAAEGSWTYVFGDLLPGNAADVVTAAGLLAQSSDGLMPWRGRPEPFKRGMIARIPPLASMKEAAE